MSDIDPPTASGKEARFVCAVCPRGCRLVVAVGAGRATVSGNACPRGAEYGLSEALDPRRILTTTLRTNLAGRPRLPVKSSGPIPKSRLLEAARALDGLVVEGRRRSGEVLVSDLLGLGVDMVATDDSDDPTREG